MQLTFAFCGYKWNKFLRLWVFGNIFYRCFKTSYKSGLNGHGCVLECPPPPFAILDHLIFVVFFSVYEYSEIYFVRVLNEHGCVLEHPPSLSPCDSRPSNFCALFIFYCVRKCQQGIGKIGIIFLYLRNNSNPNHLKVENWLLFWPSAFSRGQIVFLTSFWLHANCYAWRIT